MKMTCPYLNIGNGVHETSRYACVLTRAVENHIPITGRELLFYSGEQLLGKLTAEGRLDIMGWYACDGYSPTFYFCGDWRRITPTPKRAGFYPAIMHDFTRQFAPVKNCPWTRKQSDDWFYDTLILGGESKGLAGTFHAAVSKTLGNIWSKLTYQEDKTLWIREVKPI